MSEPIRIVGLEVILIAVADPPLRSAFGMHQPYALRSIVELVSEDGISGFAETHGNQQVLEDFERVRSLVIGRDAFEMTPLRLDVEKEFSSESGRNQGSILPGESRFDVPLRVFGALEVAAFDLIGKSTGRPVHQLLGGKVRDQVPFSAYLFYKHAGGGGEGDDQRDDRWGEILTPEALVDEAQQIVAEYGFSSLKLKGGVISPDMEIETIQGLRESFGPNMPLRIDPNTAWSIDTSLEVARALQGTLEYLEDPTSGIDGMADLRKRLLDEGNTVPLATNMAVTSFLDVAESVDKDAVQIILGDHHFWGGLRATTELGRLCETFGLGLSMHSNSHLGLSLMAMTHVAAATPHLSYACDTHYPWLDVEDEILIDGPVPIQDGVVRVPDLPGLGVEVDRDALARAHERYRQNSSYQKRDDAAEMRKHVDPDWRMVIPRW